MYNNMNIEIYVYQWTELIFENEFEAPGTCNMKLHLEEVLTNFYIV